MGPEAVQPLQWTQWIWTCSMYLSFPVSRIISSSWEPQKGQGFTSMTGGVLGASDNIPLRVYPVPTADRRLQVLALLRECPCQERAAGPLGVYGLLDIVLLLSHV